MADEQFDLNSVAHLAVGAVGPPGQRTFYLQASDKERTVTVKLEKEQVMGLSRAIEMLFEELANRELYHGPADGELSAMAELEEPLDPIFTVATIQLGHDTVRNLLVLILQGRAAEESEERVVELRLWLSPAQMSALGRQGREVAGKGRPICPLCQRPMDPDGHLCPRGNGHSKKVIED
jgi:uncharacterized repeat protein (TIGR03847 family)